ncbi:MAG: acetyl-CoA carboxylase biotin carboxyl carrier protein subunit [Clostridiales bacterium]|nr:acetyl-CoA carboxylase biotin carboxyl carrier protein subunit [Clostridiales bacterium]
MSKYRITVEGKTYEMDVELIGSNGAPVQPVKVQSAPAAPAPVVAAPKAASKPAAVSSGSVVAPMPGTVIKILKNEGDAVKAGDVVLILEAMKMENEITAPVAGTLASVNCTAGGTVAGGDVLFEVK